MDSKNSLQWVPDAPQPRKSRWGWRALVVCTTVFVGYRLYVAHAPARGGHGNPAMRWKHSCGFEDPEAVWETVPHSKLNGTLEWVPCYTDKQCARLMVPLDYAKPDGPEAGIALLKVPSKLSPSHKDYKGPILFNPGGPGGSGVGFVLSLGENLQKLLGAEYDIVGFDPRGIARTTPQVRVFKNEAEGTAWRIRETSDPMPNATEDGVPRLFGRYQVYGELAVQNAMDAAPYVTTALVARDMLGIVRAHGFEKLQYWGFSYGTVLGATYAAMFPDNVGRLIIDGVVDSYDYYTGLWSNNLLDTDKGYHMFMQACVDAGPDVCALYEPTVEKVHTRISNIFTSLKRSPLYVNADVAHYVDYGLVDYRVARTALFLFLYAPYTQTGSSTWAAQLAHAFAEAEKGNGAPLAAYDPYRFPLHCECPGRLLPPDAGGWDAQTAIMCGDAGGLRANDTLEDNQQHFENLLEDSEFAEIWVMRARCSGWRIKPVERFEGKFAGNTSYPILIAGNTADPVTPLAHAHTMSKGFNGSVVLTQDSAGHCTLSAKSLCTATTIREYFRDGKLPQNGTVCAIQDSIFPTTHSTNLEELQGEERNIMEAWAELNSLFEAPRLGFV